MDGISGVTARMAEIQSRFQELQGKQARELQAKAAAAATAGATATAGTAGAAAPATTFAGALADAVATTTGAPSVAGAAKKYQLNSKGIPTELAAYGNGKIPADALQRVGDTRHKLWAPAAESLTRMIGDARRDGVTIGITDSYRSYTEQVDVARRKGLYSQGGLAAKPGTSEHGWGMAADLDLNSKALSWMRANGEKYGYVENTPREPWHWGFEVKS